METKQFIVQTKGAVIDESKRIISGVVGSTGSLDRHGENVNPEGWNLKNYLKNPVLLFAHDYRSLPVGKALKVWVENKKLMFNLQFASTPFAMEVFQLFQEGILNAFSVGFMVQKWGESGGKYSIDEQELLELSVVPVPANPEALAKMHVKGMEQDALVLKLKALYEHLDAELKAEEETEEEVETDESVEDEAVEEKSEETEETETEEEDAEDTTDDEAQDDETDESDESVETAVNAQVVVIKATELKAIVADALKEVITDYKVVEEKIVKEVIEKSDDEAEKQEVEKKELLETLVQIRGLVVKSDSYAGTALSKLKELMAIKSQAEEGGEK